ncbi:hypothetical protein Herbaro_20195 [Herbaspirillum sp. WKF16]|uniref:hypothetical protein n=1 Tax=Herbaspirillum sp. WKF16 TaxID=3028312 RepID=UPI0023A995C4|nr:hypothetical protein [Herbaspirillum sp. WKF16]WDZ95771.1 hypothetical protein Herbaro_20195 [Herbaspirillum sp. WKF16]
MEIILIKEYGEDMDNKHEQSYADIFNRKLEEKAGPDKFHAFSVDGQDRDAGCDYVITDSDRFAIIEFKWQEKDLPSEAKKGRRRELCQELEKNEEMKNLHDRCHFISWSDSIQGKSQTNIYRKEICIGDIFGAGCGFGAAGASTESRVGLGEFAEEFFEKKRSLKRRKFEKYLAWVMTETSESKSSTVELIAYREKSDDVFTFRMNSLSEVKAWMKTYKVEPRNKQKKRKDNKF